MSIVIIELGMMFFIFTSECLKLILICWENEGLVWNLNRNEEKYALFGTGSQFSQIFTKKGNSTTKRTLL